MQYALYGFLLGFIIPYMARRFAKFMPASAAESIWRLLYPHKSVGPQIRQKNAHYRTLIKAYFWRSFIFGLTGALLFTAANLHFEAWDLPAICAFLWALLLLFEIDYKTFLLPDVITIPLLIGGFCFSVFTGVWVLSAESAIYCRVFTEGLFGIDPVGFGKFDVKPHLPSGWRKMELRRVRTFGKRLSVSVTDKGAEVKED